MIYLIYLFLLFIQHQLKAAPRFSLYKDIIEKQKLAAGGKSSETLSPSSSQTPRLQDLASSPEGQQVALPSCSASHVDSRLDHDGLQVKRKKIDSTTYTICKHDFKECGLGSISTFCQADFKDNDAQETNGTDQDGEPTTPTISGSVFRQTKQRDALNSQTTKEITSTSLSEGDMFLDNRSTVVRRTQMEQLTTCPTDDLTESESAHFGTKVDYGDTSYDSKGE